MFAVPQMASGQTHMEYRMVIDVNNITSTAAIAASANTLSVPIESTDSVFASTGVRKALWKDTAHQKKPELHDLSHEATYFIGIVS